MRLCIGAWVSAMIPGRCGVHVRVSQAAEDTGDGGAVLRFGRQSDDLAARLVAVVVHVYTLPPSVIESARKLPALSPTMEVSCRRLNPASEASQ